MRDVFFIQNFLVPTLLLCVASALDFSKGRFPNFVFLISLFLGACWIYSMTSSLYPVGYGLLASAACIIILFPLFAFNVLGAGDIKLLSVFCLITSWQTTSSIFIYSLFWGVLLGIIKLTLSGEIKNFLLSFYLNTLSRETNHPGRVPYTIALLLGWLTVQQLGGVI